MRFEDLNWMDIEKYLQQDDRLILVTGACEQHGYLSLLSDVQVPQALADAASREAGVLVAPAVSFGVSPYFLSYPGTLSLRVSTFLDLVEDIVRSAYGAGFRRILVLNGHGGNDPVRGRLVELSNQLAGLRVSWYSWWLSAGTAGVAERRHLQRNHAGWLENFPFTRVAEVPGGEKTVQPVTEILSAAATRRLYGDGVFSGAYQASDEVMQELFSTCLEEVLQLLLFKEA